MANDTDTALLDSFKHTLVSLLLQQNGQTLAGILVDSTFTFETDGNNHEQIIVIEVPVAYFSYFGDGPDFPFAATTRDALGEIAFGHLTDWNGAFYRPGVLFRVQLETPDPAWQEKVKAVLAEGGVTNQAFVTDLMFSRATPKREVITYNELKFASRTEVRIAQELERRGVLFFPLAIAVKAKTGILHEDHREVDFLVCQNGVFGILEISGPAHTGRYEKDAEKANWFREEGILCVQHYTAENAWDNTTAVIDNFLGILAQHKR
ncbi:hypothetical protein [Deinococcus sonorensis]|uniref:DUF559 domain-containing protein n=2 Tax=Deinococcus sonorensis TaxID=309891 RepID=A0AAU7UH33_9DEIO